LNPADLAIAVCGCNRPAYFRQCIEALAANEGLGDVHVFLDGSRHQAEQADDAARVLGPRCQSLSIHRQERNLGIGRHLIGARELLLNDLQYRYMLLIEDDCIVQPHFVGLNCRLQDWAERHFDNVGATSLWCLNTRPREEKAAMLDRVTLGNPHWYSYLLPRTSWQTIRPKMLEYLNMLGNRPYAQRPGATILRWIRTNLQAAPPYPGGERIVPSSLHKSYHPTQWDWVSSQDAVTAAMIYAHNMVKLFTLVNRCVNIGRHGTHGPRDYERIGPHKVLQDVFPEDAALSEFQLADPFNLPG